ncbi:TetR/AcrR family transcriptional regulator [Staphylococcus sp. 18_1_E_LY]|uniref:TetR/AcrR family transcriptional regulator n=1 Tax=Staphylococcus lloydii TaxID=2781774 RepID=A0A7T1B0J2_9STAP|nr:TetR/AcrR family transcriptional regulator [Staphylococcus lloydii]MBF7020189.1 TetR/AcrR family transcriptional regulator [Staphylococcus lloydii]MBF7027872.1 TetR/AcrR family transcriptional regulator [Staphylococcus lloydii]QPM75544.1 TetR/AcrR family transcriptional regulator [Staphylococcus lloydii]
MNQDIKSLVETIVPQLEYLSDKQRRVIESAIALFSEQGFDKTSTKEIAQRANVAEGTVFKQFKSKRMLLYAGLIPILRDHIAPVAVKQFTDELNDTKHFDEFINLFVDNRSQFIYDNRRILKVVLNEAITNENFQNILVNIFTHKLTSSLKDKIVWFISNGEMRDVEPEFFIRTVIAQILNLNIPVIINNNYTKGESYKQFALFVKDGLYKMFKQS